MISWYSRHYLLPQHFSTQPTVHYKYQRTRFRYSSRVISPVSRWACIKQLCYINSISPASSRINTCFDFRVRICFSSLLASCFLVIDTIIFSRRQHILSRARIFLMIWFICSHIGNRGHFAMSNRCFLPISIIIPHYPSSKWKWHFKMKLVAMPWWEANTISFLVNFYAWNKLMICYRWSLTHFQWPVTILLYLFEGFEASYYSMR